MRCLARLEPTLRLFFDDLLGSLEIPPQEQIYAPTFEDLIELEMAEVESLEAAVDTIFPNETVAEAEERAALEELWCYEVLSEEEDADGGCGTFF